MTDTILATIRTIQFWREKQNKVPPYAMYIKDLLPKFGKTELDKALKELVHRKVIRIGRTINDWYIEVL